MKIFEEPEMRISAFARADVLTASDPAPASQQTAVEKAMAEADKINDSIGAFVVDID